MLPPLQKLLQSLSFTSETAEIRKLWLGMGEKNTHWVEKAFGLVWTEFEPLLNVFAAHFAQWWLVSFLKNTPKEGCAAYAYMANLHK